jgi:hypothetical protein
MPIQERVGHQFPAHDAHLRKVMSDGDRGPRCARTARFGAANEKVAAGKPILAINHYHIDIIT